MDYPFDPFCGKNKDREHLTCVRIKVKCYKTLQNTGALKLESGEI